MMLRRLMAIGTVVLIGTGIPIGGTVAQAQASGCVAVSVVNYAPKAAQAMLRKHGCLPGKAKDGRHYVVVPQCVHGNQVGLIVDQKPVGSRLGPRQSLTLWQGASTTPTDPGCAGMWAQPNAYDGYFIGTFTVTESESPAYPAGNQVGNLSFTVTNGQITGSVTGTVVNAISTNALISALGVQCPVGGDGLMFTKAGTALADEVTCSGTFGDVQGRFTAGAFFEPRYSQMG